MKRITLALRPTNNKRRTLRGLPGPKRTAAVQMQLAHQRLADKALRKLLGHPLHAYSYPDTPEGLQKAEGDAAEITKQVYRVLMEHSLLIKVVTKED